MPRRAVNDIKNDILIACLQPCTASRVSFLTFTSYPRTKTWLKELLLCGLVEPISTRICRGRELYIYKTTPKGRKVMDAYSLMEGVE